MSFVHESMVFNILLTYIQQNRAIGYVKSVYMIAFEHTAKENSDKIPVVGMFQPHKSLPKNILYVFR